MTPPPQQRAMAPPSPIFNLDIAPREVSRPPRERSESPPPPPADDYAASGSAEDISAPFSPSSDYGPEERKIYFSKFNRNINVTLFEKILKELRNIMTKHMIFLKCTYGL